MSEGELCALLHIHRVTARRRLRPFAIRIGSRLRYNLAAVLREC